MLLVQSLPTADQNGLSVFWQKSPAPEEAFKLARRFEFHFTAKKGSWLNMSEIELSALFKAMPGSQNGRYEDLKA